MAGCSPRKSGMKGFGHRQARKRRGKYEPHIDVLRRREASAKRKRDDAVMLIVTIAAFVLAWAAILWMAS